MQLAAIRHGETQDNKLRRLSGQLDVPLNTTGIEQANALAERLTTSRFDAIYCSDLLRARQTADAIAEAAPYDITPQVCEWLRERHAGVLQGLSKTEMKARHREVRNAWKSTDRHAPITGGGEAAAQFHHRIITGLQALAVRHSGSEIALVSHAGVMREIFNHVFNSEQNGNHLRVANTALCHFRYEQGHWSMDCWGDRAHWL